MAYAKQTYNYGIPYISTNEILDGTEQEIAAEILDNQIRAGILGAGGTRVFQNGTWSTVVDPSSGLVNLILSPASAGLPSVQGIAHEGLIEIYYDITWQDLLPNSFYYIYLQATDDTYVDPTAVIIVASLSELVSLDYLFLATIDTTGSDLIPPTTPVVDNQPTGKPTAKNLFDFMTAQQDPFGPSFTQTDLTVLSQFFVWLDPGMTALFRQLSSSSGSSVITIENHSNPTIPGVVNGRPDIFSSFSALVLGDLNVPNGIALSDQGHTTLPGTSVSILDALDETYTDLLAHIADDTDPHGTDLYQTNLHVSGILDAVQLNLHPPAPPPPPPPSPPPGPPPSPPLPPGQLPYLDIDSSGELRIGDIRGGLAWSDPNNPYFHGTDKSLMGALNDLLQQITDLENTVGGITGTTQEAMAPVIFEINADSLGLPLHFRLTAAEDEDFSTIVVTKESKLNQTGWYYEYQPPPASPPLPPGPPPSPPSPPSPPQPPGLPGVIVPLPLPGLPIWVALPPGGVPGHLQVSDTGLPIRVKYEPQSGDGLYCRHMYSIAVQEFNGEYGEADLSAMVFD